MEGKWYRFIQLAALAAVLLVVWMRFSPKDPKLSPEEALSVRASLQQELDLTSMTLETYRGRMQEIVKLEESGELYEAPPSPGPNDSDTSDTNVISAGLTRDQESAEQLFFKLQKDAEPILSGQSFTPEEAMGLLDRAKKIRAVLSRDRKSVSSTKSLESPTKETE